MSTHICSANRQKSGYDTYQSNATLEKYDISFDTWVFGPCNFSISGGLFINGLKFYYSEESFAYLRVAMIDFDHKADIDYSIKTKPLYCKDEAVSHIEVTMGESVKQLRYCITHNAPVSTLDRLMAGEADGILTADGVISFDLKPGFYNVEFIPCDENGEWLGYEGNDMYIWSSRSYTIYSNADDEYEWVDYGEATVTDGFYKYYSGNLIPEDIANKKFTCKLLTRKDMPGKVIRVVNPCGPANPAYLTAMNSGNFWFEDENEDYYLDINVENPDRVYVYYRPLGPVMKEENSYTDRFALGTKDFWEYYYLQNGVDPDKITTWGKYKWNRISFPGTTLSLELEQKLSIASNSVDENLGFDIVADDDVEYIKYTFVNDESGMMIADMIESEDESLSVYVSTRNNGQQSRAGGNTFRIAVPSTVVDCKRVIAVPFGADEVALGSFLDEPVNMWHSVGMATIDTGVEFADYGLKSSAGVERYGASGKYRLVDVSSVSNAGKYLYINATDADNVNFSGDGDKGHFDTGLFMNGYSTEKACALNTVYNLVERGMLSSSTTYSLGHMSPDGVIHAGEDVFGLIVFNSEGNMLWARITDPLVITLPKNAVSSGIDNVTVNVGGDEDGKVEYFNMQGVRVEHPSNGIYVRRQGSKAVKVLIR